MRNTPVNMLKVAKASWQRREWSEHRPLPPALQRIKDDLIRRGRLSDTAPKHLQA